MKYRLATVVAAIALLAGTGGALAQAVIELGPQQRTTIKEYVVKERVKPITVRERISVGTVLPPDVELVAVPQAWGPSVARYRYVYWDNHVVLVEPSSRKVIEIID
jgi:hypothetical protein